LPPRDGSLPDLDLISILMERQEMGPISSRSILEELARIVPAFAEAAGGEVPGFGLVIDGDEKPVPNAMPNYVDPWHAPRGKPTLVADIAQ
jgi:NADH-quinone oxidoreductase subunit G